MDNLFQARNAKEKKGNKALDIKETKDKTIKSLFEVEHFLCQTKKAINSIKLYKILK